jgi:hypothetical protein
MSERSLSPTPPHADDAMLAAFVRGEIGDDGFASHLADCSACALRLGAAARLEVAMVEAAQVMAQPGAAVRPSPRVSRRSWASELALAASLVLGVGMPSRWVESEANDGAVASDRGGMSVDPGVAACMLPDEGGLCDAPDEPWLDEALAMTVDPRGGTEDFGEFGLCLPAADGSDLVCPADI